MTTNTTKNPRLRRGFRTLEGCRRTQERVFAIWDAEERSAAALQAAGWTSATGGPEGPPAKFLDPFRIRATGDFPGYFEFGRRD